MRGKESRSAARRMSEGRSRLETFPHIERLYVSCLLNKPGKIAPEAGTEDELPPETMELLQGTLDLLILKSLALGPLHGLGVARRIEQVTKGTFSVKPGSLFPALHRMEETGWLTAYWGESSNNRKAKYYELTKRGRRQLDTETERWGKISLAIGRALSAES